MQERDTDEDQSIVGARNGQAAPAHQHPAGADDYLVKPFASAELLARVQALLRRKTVGQDYLLRIGSLQIDHRAQEASRHGQRLALPPTAYAILLLLAEAWPRALTRSTLIHRLWNDEAPDSDPLRSHLYVLRQQLDRPFTTPMLKTVHGVGFRLLADTPDATEADAPSGPTP